MLAASLLLLLLWGGYEFLGFRFLIGLAVGAWGMAFALNKFYREPINRAQLELIKAKIDAEREEVYAKVDQMLERRMKS